jgi:hypothetical protein
MRKTLLSILFLLLLAVPAIAQKPAPAASAPAQPSMAPVKPSEIEDLKIENLKLKLSLYTQHKVDLQREEDSVNQDGEKLAEQIIAAHPGYHLDFKTLMIVSDAPAEAAKATTPDPPASPAPVPATAPKK